ncbi:MAG: hypothetical protein ACP5E8_00890 [Thermoplasmata archaeon]
MKEIFIIRLKHILAGVSFISLLTAFEVMTIPVASGIIVLSHLLWEVQPGCGSTHLFSSD